ncbi:NYN domain-containing protein [Allokutzneria sp. A3M-2-11 16]|uniref:NYN domain-containing protein n=1 Tax=Allokutzneria sp. A3M-2-11 16 TaxID=2962043 RepID=UPI0020B6D92B|nr:NYN domain-containing protein [Allokutzneria sp. A3M-2-11 16]MCP3799354.1 NYN domain-containing protein [Allokutzneria sp. A3M-2-11 16]
MGRAVFYVDGMNAYHGIRSKYGREFLWLDWFALAQQIRVPDEILTVRYFTTIVAGEPDAARRQETYLAALTAHRPKVQVVRGRYQKKTFKCRSCGHRWTCGCEPPVAFRTYEEKLTDVALAVSMVKDAAEGYGDTSVLISTDSDLNPAIIATAEISHSERSTSRAHPVGNHRRGAFRQTWCRSSSAGITCSHRCCPTR